MLRNLYVVLCALIIVAAARAAGSDIVSAPDINIAGEQRMLSQRIAKAYVQLGLDVAPATAIGQLHDSITRFDLNLERLHVISGKVAGGEEAFRRMVMRWEALRAATDIPAGKESSELVARRSIEVLDAAERLVVVLEAATSGGEGSRVNRPARLRMLSQRLVKAYMLYSSGVGAGEHLREMQGVSREFSDGLADLAALPDNSPEMRAELAEIALQWEWLQAALLSEGAVSYRLVVAEAGDSILVAADRLVRLYEQAGGR